MLPYNAGRRADYPRVASSSFYFVHSCDLCQEESGRVDDVEPRDRSATGDEVIERLVVLGYVTPQNIDGDGDCPVDGRLSLRQGVATFVHVHDLEAFKQEHFPYYYLHKVVPALHVELSKVPPSRCRTKPLGLRWFEGVSNKMPPLSKHKVRSWPFKNIFLHVSDALVNDVWNFYTHRGTLA